MLRGAAAAAAGWLLTGAAHAARVAQHDTSTGTVLSAAGSTRPTAGALPQLPVGGAADAYTLVWQDEFEGNALDSASWTATRGSHGSTERQYYLPDNVAVSNGTLRLTTRHEPRLVQHLNPNSQQG